MHDITLRAVWASSVDESPVTGLDPIVVALCLPRYQSVNMTTHVIHFTGNIHQGSALQLQDVSLQALAQGATEIRYHVTTDGGSTMLGFWLFNFIRSLPVPVTIHNTGNIESMGIILFLAADRRIAAPHSRFLLHPLNWGFPNGSRLDHARLNEHSLSLDNDFDRYVSIFDERTAGAAQKTDIRACLKNTARVLTAEDAVNANLATEIGDVVLSADSIRWWITV